MDNVTHTLTALLLSRAGLERLSPRATLCAVLAANAPDLDVVAGFAGQHAYLDAHRGWTHGLPLAPLVALVPVLLAGLIRRPTGFRWLGAWLASAAGLASHLLLDWTNIYGIRLLAPVSNEWFRLDITAVVDLWILALLGFAAAWPALARLVASEIGARGTSHGAGLARFALVCLLAYEGARYFTHARAVAMLESRVYDNEAPRTAVALPDFANPFTWTGLVELDSAWRVIPVSLPRDFDPAAGHVFHRQPASPAMAAAARTAAFQALGRFSRTVHWQSVPADEPEGAYDVTAVDLRFALPGEGRFTASARVDANARVLESGFRFAPGGAMPRPR